jgi:hypothetical protein
MDRNQWREFLSKWSQAVLATELARAFPEEVIASGWLGYPGASAEEIEHNEARLGTNLPPSYRSFLEASNGFRMVRPYLTRVWSTSEIEWLRIRRPELISTWRMGETLGGDSESIPDEDYFVYGEQQDSVWMRSEYLQDTLEVSDLDPEMDGIYLLNPLVVTTEGEWEAWYLSSSLPGAARYRSFEEMMEAEYQRCLEDLNYEIEFPQGYMEKVWERLQLRAELRIVVNLEAIIAGLEAAAEKAYRSADQSTAGSRRLPGYDQAAAYALQEAAEQVRELHARGLTDQELAARLGDMAAEYEHQSLRDLKTDWDNLDLWQVLRAGLDYKFRQDKTALDRQFQDSGRPHGFMTAAGIIRQHLRAG